MNLSSKTLADNIRRLRRSKGLSQRELAMASRREMMNRAEWHIGESEWA